MKSCKRGVARPRGHRPAIIGALAGAIAAAGLASSAAARPHKPEPAAEGPKDLWGVGVAPASVVLIDAAHIAELTPSGPRMAWLYFVVEGAPLANKAKLFRTLEVFDCGQRSYVVKSAEAYDQGGGRLGGYTTPTPSMAVKPGTLADLELTFVCSDPAARAADPRFRDEGDADPVQVADQTWAAVTAGAPASP